MTTTAGAILPIAENTETVQVSEPIVYRTIHAARLRGMQLEDVELELQVTAPNANPRNPKFDLLPRRTPRWPVVVLAHGGTWRRGSLSSMARLAVALAERGVICVNVDYRLAPFQRELSRLQRRARRKGLGDASTAASEALRRRRFPGPLFDLKAAVRLTRYEIARGVLREIGDAKRVGVCGTSAGGYLLALLAVTNSARVDAKELGGMDLEGIAETYVTDRAPSAKSYSSVADFAAVISMTMPDLAQQYRFRRRTSPGIVPGPKSLIGTGPRDAPTAYRAASPKTYLVVADDDGNLTPARTLDSDVALPPFLQIHAKGDTTAPFAGARQFRTFIERAGGATSLIAFGQAAGHTAWLRRFGRFVPQISEMAYSLAVPQPASS